MKRLLVFIIALVAVATGVLAAADAVGVTQYSLKIVAHDQYGNPVPGALVEAKGLYRFQGYTDEHGVCVFQLQGYQLGAYSVAVSKPSYQGFSRVVLVPEKATSKTTTVDAMLIAADPGASHPVVRLSVDRRFLAVDPGGSGEVGFKVASTSQVVAVNAFILEKDAKVDASVDPLTGSYNFTGSVTVTAAENAEYGSYTLKISAGAEYVSVCDYVAVLVPDPQGDFGVKLSEGYVEAVRGSSTGLEVEVLPFNGFNGEVYLSAVVPEGVTAVFNPASGKPPFKSVVTFTVDKGAKRGEFLCKIVAKSGEVERYAVFKLGVETFVTPTAISLVPSSVRVAKDHGVVLHGVLREVNPDGSLGKGVSGAQISVYWQPPDENALRLLTDVVYTRDDGTFILDIDRLPKLGTYYFMAKYGGDLSRAPCESAVVAVRVFDPDTGAGVEPKYQTTLVLSAPASDVPTGSKVTLTARLSVSEGGDPSGHPINFEYSLDGGSTWRSIGRILTDDEGVAELDFIPTVAGTYTVRASYLADDNPDYAPASTTAVFRAYSSGDEDPDAPPLPYYLLTVKAVVEYDPSNTQPLSGVTVEVYRDGELVDQGVTGMNGTFEKDYPYGTYKVVVYSPDPVFYTPTTVEQEVALTQSQVVTAKFYYNAIYYRLLSMYNPLGTVLGLNFNPSLEIAVGFALVAAGVFAAARAVREEE